MLDSRDYRRNKYTPTAPGTKELSPNTRIADARQTTPLGGAKTPTASTYLTRLAKTAGGTTQPSGCGGSGWISGGSQTPVQQSIESRLRWVSTAFKPQQPQATQQAQQPAHQTHLANAGDLKDAVEAMRKRVQATAMELAAIEKDLSEIQQKIA